MEERAAAAGKRLESTTKAEGRRKRPLPKASSASQIVGSAKGIVTAIIAAESIRLLADAIGQRGHEAVRMETAGMQPAEVEEAKAIAARLVKMLSVDFADRPHVPHRPRDQRYDRRRRNRD